MIIKNLENKGFNLILLAEEFNLSKRQFQRKIKKITGLSPKKYEHEVAMQWARQLLDEEKCSSVKAVALSVGINQTYRFVRYYEARFGKNPQEYFETFAR